MILLSLLLIAVPWLLLRREAGARWSRWAVLDVAPAAAAFALLLALTSRPLLSGAVVASLLLMLLVVDRAKRQALEEGLVFTDHTLLPLVVRHPGLYLPFLPPAWPALGLAVATLGLMLLAWLEPPVDMPRVGIAVAAIGILAVLWRADLLAAPTGDPALDAARFGPLATLALHRAVAAKERPARRAALAPRPGPLAQDAPHVVLVQCESFCDPRRFVQFPTDHRTPVLPHWERLSADALAHGSLAVPGFGANTMRTEFAVLSGLAAPALGLDHLNPYARLARRPVHSLAHALPGHEAIALHPFDPRFFRRDLVLPALGFSRFEAAADFAMASRKGAHVSDAALGVRLIALLREATSPIFLYAITMQAHGPWPGTDPAAVWLDHLADTDAMLGAIAAAAAELGRPVVLAAYGDHRPALAMAAGGRDTDYLVWRSDRAGQGAVQAMDPAALHQAILSAVRGSDAAQHNHMGLP